MGDPLSVTAGTAGIISLGLQVCGGLINYCRAWKSHDKDIEEALEKLTDLELTLRSLSDILSVVESLDDSTADTLGRARHKIQSCAAALNKLHGALIEYESIAQPSGVLDKLHNVRIRSMSFLNKEKLKGLRASVSEIHNNLGSAIQILNLHLVLKQNFALRNLTIVNRDRIDQVPDTVEQALIKHLDLQGRRFSMLQQDVLNASSQQAQTMQQLTQNIAALQLGMIQKPSLVQSAYEEQRRLQSQHTNVRSRSVQRCRCRTLIKYKPFLDSRWNVARVSSTLIHRRDCPYFHEATEEKQFGLRVSFSGRLLRATIQAAFSMTRGAGGFSINPTLAFNSIVPSDSGPFKIMNTSFTFDASAADMQATFAFKKRELLHLYQQGKASPRDIDENGNTVMHEACKIQFLEILDGKDSNIFGIYFQFLRDLYELGVPLNNMNARGLTPLGELVLNYGSYGFAVVPGRLEGSLTFTNLKMLDIGAEFPLFTKETTRLFEDDVVGLGRVFAWCPDLAEAFGCSEISQAILAKSWPRLTAAIHSRKEFINQPNVIGQTPLHFSVEWSESMPLLIDAGADVDAIDDFGLPPIFYATRFILLKPFSLLGEAQCVLHRKSSERYHMASVPEFVSLLEDTMGVVAFREHKEYRYDASIDDAEAIVDATIRIVVERRRVLESLVRTSLDAQAARRLQLSPEILLDRNASLAIEMLREKIDVPNSLDRLSPSHSTVYHIRDLNLRQANVLWDAGFRDVNERDSLGHSALMNGKTINFCLTFNEELELAAWLVEKGGDLYCRQRHAFQKRIRNDREHPDNGYGEFYITDRASSTAALHCLASHWGVIFSPEDMIEEDIKEFPGRMISEKSRQIWNTVLTDALPDCCRCACSTEGCKAYTMLVKSLNDGFLPGPRKGIHFMTLVLAPTLHVDQLSLAWLRHEMIRFNTFETLKLRHTCCERGSYMEYDPQVIYEPYDKEECDEIAEEQAELVEELETLLVEFENKYEELSLPFSEFFDGYWSDRMKEVLSEEIPIDHKALRDMGVVLKKIDGLSYRSFEDLEEDIDGAF